MSQTGRFGLWRAWLSQTILAMGSTDASLYVLNAGVGVRSGWCARRPTRANLGDDNGSVFSRRSLDVARTLGALTVTS